MCSLKIKPIDAGFNIFGMPAFIGYYVSHDWTTGNMSWAPHTDSVKEPMQSGAPPKQELRVKYQSENTPNGDVWALTISLLIALGALSFFLYVSYYKYDTGEFATTTDAAGWVAAGVVIIAISFFILNWLLLLILMPGNTVQEVPDASETIAKVSASNMTILGLISVFVYKMCGKKRVTKTVEAKAEVTTSAVEIDELINSIE